MSKTTNTITNILVLVVCACLMLALPVGWCMNLYKLMHSDFTTVEAEEVVRCIGLAVPPVGGVVGWF